MNSSRTVSNVIFLFLKISLFVFLVLVILEQIQGNKQSLFFLLSRLDNVNTIYVLFSVFVLMFLNWLLEAKKWLLLVGQFQLIKFRVAIKSVFSGCAFALITPARLGDYAGRLYGISPQNRTKALFANAIGSIAQNIITISFGIIGIILYRDKINMNKEVIGNGSILIVALIISILFILFFKWKFIIRLLKPLSNYKIVKYILYKSSFINHISSRDKFVILTLAFARYAVFSIQYVLLLYHLDVSTAIFPTLIGVFVVFFVQLGIPLPSFLEILVRSQIAIWVFSIYSNDVVAIMSATFLIWLINLLVPALIGAYFIISLKRI